MHTGASPSAMHGRRLVLGSSSKWRRAILERILSSDNAGDGDVPLHPCAGCAFEQLSPDIDEKAVRDDDPRRMVLLIANAKMDAVLKQVPYPAVVITSDQVIVHEGVVREKPETEAVCRDYLLSYNAAPAEAVVGVVVHDTVSGKRVDGVAVARQFFRGIDEELVQSLIAKGDVMWCAGGFTVEEMSSVATRREGEIETIEGLPRTLTLDLLRKALQG